MRFFISLAFDGECYHGWQIQPGDVTVQGVLQDALATLLRHPVEVVGAGRTDAGVNARLMVAHTDIPDECVTPDAEHFCRQLTYRLNKLLPRDISIYGIRQVDPMAHARFDARSRTYKYYLVTERNPFLRKYSYHFPLPLDFQAMNEAAALLCQYTDFTSFAKLHADTKTNNCKVMYAKWEQSSAEPLQWIFTITADRFLRNMVRAIVGTLLEVGRGRLSIDDFRGVIEQKNRSSAGSSVPGNALFLYDIKY